MRVQASCASCLEEEEELPATHCCSSCSLALCTYHAKKHERNNHVVIPNNSKLDESYNPVNTAPLCKDHFIPINCFCSNCKMLICSSCAVSLHSAHQVSLISEIEATVKKETVDELQKFIIKSEEWSQKHQLDENNLTECVTKVRARGEELKKQIHSKLDELMNDLKKREQQLLVDLDELVDNQCNIVTSIRNHHEIVEDLKRELTSILSMNGYTLMERKINKFKQTMDSFELISTQVGNFISLENIDKFNIEQFETNEISSKIGKIGKIVKILPFPTVKHCFANGEKILEVFKDNWNIYKISPEIFNVEDRKIRNIKFKVHQLVQGSNTWCIIFGIVNSSSRLDTYLSENGYGLIFLNGQKSCSGKGTPFLSPMKVGDVVEVIVQNNSLLFSINGDDPKVAFDNLPNFEYTFGVSICAKHAKLEII
ncbi:predicted protein [Naegleria gruberi]|uniref:Predicted protein n=1 Tax=Naegleria gruberi TaxID=5762 RepID=D2V649_NAEGR|nr:uncharacterized protein NAEGRDRAFT_64310 [Naegleria gruberi]EFC47904.1 predicted protein [Naegleria gruberi]|eukprot:XP_002680648.1 predicted protein [Naegleria gruberi strain NEG-M]